MKTSADPARKIKLYAGTATWLWLASIVAWWIDRPGFLYLVRPPEILRRLPGNGFVYGFCAAVVGGMLAQTVLVRVNPKFKVIYQRQMAKLGFFLPVTAGERAWFAVVSVSAGICEEVLYRGFLYHSFADFWHWSVIAGLIAAAAFFGLGHGYQGVTGILTTGILGGVLSLIYLSTGSLLAPMILHAVLDLRILLFPRIRRRAETISASAT
ncbi:MAG: type II CAAX endopeptidase family protein [Acidobacteriaceae bacterium]